MNEDRLSELEEEELKRFDWDFVLLTETWRAEQEEVFYLEDEHLFLAAGGTKGKGGVAVIVNKKWKSGFRAWRAINERIGVLELDVLGVRLTIVAVYMPHAAYPDVEVERA